MKHGHIAVALLLIASAIAGGWSIAYAGGYGFIGSAWTVNTYTHDVSFEAPSSDVNFNKVQLLSNTAWYDTQFVCMNNGGNITLSPGIGQSDLGIVRPLDLSSLLTQADCPKVNGKNVCSEQFTYFSKLSELQQLQAEQPAIYTALCGSRTPNACFLFVLDLPTNFKCQNKLGTLIEVRTKGVCAIATAKTCDTATSCTTASDMAIRFTAASFNVPEGTVFDATFPDEACRTCALGGTCPAPTP